MRFNPAMFDRLLSTDRGGLGQHILWRPALRCPCHDEHSGAPRQGCPVCEGRGVSWSQPQPAWTGLAGQKSARAWATSGQFETGDVVVTIPSDSPFWQAAEQDRVTFTDSSQPFTQQMRRGEADRLGPAFRAATIERVTWIEGGALVDAEPFDRPSVILGSNGQPYLHPEGWAYMAPTTPGLVPFPSIRADGTLVWRDAGGPEPGEGYVVKGRCEPEYFIFTELPQDRAHAGGQALPRRCVLRRFDMGGR